MIEYIDKSDLVSEIERRKITAREKAEIAYDNNNDLAGESWSGKENICNELLSFIDTLKVKNPYEKDVQYDSIKAGIEEHAETYSFNIESELFPQLTKEQQKLWRKEIEQAYISGGDSGYLFARDARYKENLEVKEVDLDKEINKWQGCKAFPEGVGITPLPKAMEIVERTARHFFELGLQAQKEE